MTQAHPAGTLYLIPTALADPFIPDATLPRTAQALLARLDYFIVENAKSARHFLKTVGTALPLQSLEMRELNEHTAETALQDLLEPIANGRDAGLISEAGAPAVADPGANLVALAHRSGVAVQPVVGPSSILLALMASGLNGQSFAFQGYLPADRPGRLKALAELERESAAKHMTQIFIETPYRNDALFADIMATCAADTIVCVATQLTAPDQSIATRTVGKWRAVRTELGKRPTVFLLLAPSHAPARKGGLRP